MPEPTHRRKGKNRPRPTRSAPPERNPEPSPSWVPATGVGLLVGGLLVILLGYLWLGTLTQSWPVFGANWSLVVGFMLLLGGFFTLTKWQ